jgi:hypothetical protein
MIELSILGMEELHQLAVQASYVLSEAEQTSLGHFQVKITSRRRHCGENIPNLPKKIRIEKFGILYFKTF